MIREDVNQASNEITSEVSPGYNCSYTYDANENRLTKTLNGVADSYNYDNGDKLTSITSGGTTVQSFGYDSEKFHRLDFRMCHGWHSDSFHPFVKGRKLMVGLDGDPGKAGI